MRDNVDYKKIGKGLYKIAFTLCIFVLCVITIVITGNYEKSATTDLKMNESRSEIPLQSVDTYKNDENTDVPSENMPKNDTYVMQVDDNVPIEYVPNFLPPVHGEILKDFSDTIPLYNKTMDDWRIHFGIDIHCLYGTEVISSEKGMVTDVGYDMLYGNYVEVSLNDFTLRYTSLESGVSHSVGDEVNKGDLIGYVSDSCISEICDEPHLHFEMKKDGKYVNPREYIY